MLMTRFGRKLSSADAPMARKENAAARMATAARCERLGFPSFVRSRRDEGIPWSSDIGASAARGAAAVVGVHARDDDGVVRRDGAGVTDVASRGIAAAALPARLIVVDHRFHLRLRVEQLGDG